MGRGDFSRPDFGRLKPPIPKTDVLKKFHYFCDAQYLIFIMHSTSTLHDLIADVVNEIF